MSRGDNEKDYTPDLLQSKEKKLSPQNQDKSTDLGVQECETLDDMEMHTNLVDDVSTPSDHR